MIHIALDTNAAGIARRRHAEVCSDRERQFYNGVRGALPSPTDEAIRAYLANDPLCDSAAELLDMLETLIDHTAIVKRFGNDDNWKKARALINKAKGIEWKDL